MVYKLKLRNGLYCHVDADSFHTYVRERGQQVDPTFKGRLEQLRKWLDWASTYRDVIDWEMEDE